MGMKVWDNTLKKMSIGTVCLCFLLQGCTKKPPDDFMSLSFMKEPGGHICYRISDLTNYSQVASQKPKWEKVSDSKWILQFERKNPMMEKMEVMKLLFAQSDSKNANIESIYIKEQLLEGAVLQASLGGILGSMRDGIAEGMRKEKALPAACLK